MKNEVKLIKEEEIKDMYFYFSDNIKFIKNIIIDSSIIQHQVDF